MAETETETVISKKFQIGSFGFMFTVQPNQTEWESTCINFKERTVHNCSCAFMYK